MGNSHHLSRAQRGEADGKTETIGNPCAVRHHVAGLCIDIIGISGIDKAIFCVYGSDAPDAYRGGGANALQNSDEQCVGLGRNAAGHAGGKHSIHPHAWLNAAQTGG